MHPYPEVFILLGQVRFRVGDKTVEAHADQIVIGPANVPHGFTNTGTEPLSMAVGSCISAS